jgi:pyruvate/2-oxoglutarate dehydrogenase complex dihydrolipoamide dehydrogenase (E3) component
MPDYDAIIIGTGQAGPALTGRLVGAGLKVAVVERKLFGGTCVNTGCTPTKTLVASAYAAHVARRAADYGVTIGSTIKVDMKAVKARKDGGVEKQGNSIAVKVQSDGKTSQIVGTHLLVAIGRRPNTDDLGLDKAGIATDARGYIPVDDQLRTNVPGVWALGDCNGCGAFTHTSWNDFEIVAANILDNDQRRVSDRISAYALYTDPPLGRVGMTEAEVRKTGGELKPLQ